MMRCAHLVWTLPTCDRRRSPIGFSNRPTLDNSSKIQNEFEDILNFSESECWSRERPPHRNEEAWRHGQSQPEARFERSSRFANSLSQASNGRKRPCAWLAQRLQLKEPADCGHDDWNAGREKLLTWLGIELEQLPRGESPPGSSRLRTGAMSSSAGRDCTGIRALALLYPGRLPETAVCRVSPFRAEWGGELYYRSRPRPGCSAADLGSCTDVHPIRPCALRTRAALHPCHAWPFLKADDRRGPAARTRCKLAIIVHAHQRNAMAKLLLLGRPRLDPGGHHAGNPVDRRCAGAVVGRA